MVRERKGSKERFYWKNCSKESENTLLDFEEVTQLVDIEQEYDDDSVARMPRSAVRFRSTQPTQALNAPQRITDTLAGEASVTRRVSGTTRFLLWCLLLFCLAFLFNGLVWPAINSAMEQIKYGDARIATYDLNNKHWITEETNGRMRIVVSNPDGSHNQVLTTVVSKK